MKDLHPSKTKLMRNTIHACMPEGQKVGSFGSSKNCYFTTLVEQQSQYMMMVRVANEGVKSVVTELIKHSQRLPETFCKSLT